MADSFQSARVASVNLACPEAQRNEDARRRLEFDGSAGRAGRLARMDRVVKMNIEDRERVHLHDPIHPRASLGDARRTSDTLFSPWPLCLRAFV
jgi:hypothetical protein